MNDKYRQNFINNFVNFNINYMENILFSLSYKKKKYKNIIIQEYIINTPNILYIDNNKY